VVERLATLAGSRNQDAEIFLDIFLPDQVREGLRPEGLVQSVIRFRFRVK
jgi:hypothetical protein